MRPAALLIAVTLIAGCGGEDWDLTPAKPMTMGQPNLGALSATCNQLLSTFAISCTQAPSVASIGGGCTADPWVVQAVTYCWQAACQGSSSLNAFEECAYSALCSARTNCPVLTGACRSTSVWPCIDTPTGGCPQSCSAP
jgi:hypothetical protein